LLRTPDPNEQQYSIEIRWKIITDAKPEVVCVDETRTAEAPAPVRERAKTGQLDAGWIYVSDILSVFQSGMR